MKGYVPYEVFDFKWGVEKVNCASAAMINNSYGTASVYASTKKWRPIDN